MSCRNTSPVTRNYIGNTGWELRHRTAYDTTCQSGIHGSSAHNEEFNSTFHTVCGNWITNLNAYASSVGGFTVDWVGDVGVTVCKTGYHGEGRAFDLTQLRFSNGTFIDMNWAWKTSGCATAATRRRYLAVVASIRRHAATVLTAWYNVDHQNHVHFDNGVALAPIRMSTVSDTTFIQATCNYMNGESLVIDGDWGPLTDAAYGRLLTKLRMQCRNPRGNTADMALLCELIAKAGITGQAAGAFVGPC
jgi:Extensin-like protein C-terminus